MEAAKSGHVSIVEYLIRAGADIGKLNQVSIDVKRLRWGHCADCLFNLLVEARANGPGCQHQRGDQKDS